MPIFLSSRIRIGFAVGLALATSGCSPAGAPQNESIIGAMPRLQMVVDDERTAYYLVDSATGDLWRLQPEGVRGQWTRVADGPADLRKLTSSEVLGRDGDDD